MDTCAIIHTGTIPLTKSEMLLPALLIVISVWIIIEIWVEIRCIENRNNRDE